MAIIDLAGSKTGVDLTTLETKSVLGTGLAFTNETTTGFTAIAAGGGHSPTSGFDATGTGFAYDSNATPTAGTITGLSYFDQNTKIVVSDFSSSVANFPGSLLAGNDTIKGSAFDDVLTGGAGNNTIDGGAGSDTVSYQGAANISGHFSWGIGVDLEIGTVNINHVNIGGVGNTYQTDTLISLENIIGSNAQNSLGLGHVGSGGDVLSGTAGDNKIYGMGGNDTIDGRGGNDTLDGGSGDDLIYAGKGNNTVIGGDGFDTIDFSSNDAVTTGKAGYIVDLKAGMSWSAYGTNHISTVENVNGSAGNDWISGDDGANVISGGAGNDVIYGQGGNDTIIGGDGHNALFGGAGDDTITSGAGSSWLEGGDGNDTLTVNAGTSHPGIWSNLWGGTGNDTLIATGNGPTGMHGGDGNDTLLFGSGTTYADGGKGADIFGFNSEAPISGAHFAQVSDFEVGIDHIKAAGKVTVSEWGANTGIQIDDAGVHKTIMLLNVTAQQLQAHSDWLIPG